MQINQNILFLVILLALFYIFNQVLRYEVLILHYLQATLYYKDEYRGEQNLWQLRSLNIKKEIK